MRKVKFLRGVSPYSQWHWFILKKKENSILNTGHDCFPSLQIQNTTKLPIFSPWFLYCSPGTLTTCTTEICFSAISVDTISPNDLPRGYI